MRSSQGRRKKKTEFVRVILVQAIFPYRSRKKLPISDLDCHSCAGAMQQYPESHHLCTKPCSSVQKKKLRHPCAWAMQHCPAEAKASSSIRSSYLRTSIGGTIVSPLVNTTSGLSGGRRGGGVSGAAPAPSLCRRPGCLPELWPWIWPVESVALLFSSGRHTPATAPAHHDVRAQPCVDCAAPLGELSALFPSHLRQEPRCFSFEGASWRGARISSPLSAAAMLPPALPRVGR